MNKIQNKVDPELLKMLNQFDQTPEKLKAISDYLLQKRSDLYPDMIDVVRAFLGNFDTITALVPLLNLVPEKVDEINYVLVRGLLNFPKRVADLLEVKDKLEQMEQRYRFIAAEPGYFIYRITHIKKVFDFKSFLDVGSGIGEKPLLVFWLFNDVKAAGIEYNAVTSKIAFEIVHNYCYPFRPSSEHRLDLEHADGFTYGDYGKFDLLYTYMPIAGPKLFDLYNSVWSGMKVGACLWEISPQNDRYARFLRETLKLKLTVVNKILEFDHPNFILRKTGETSGEVVDFDDPARSR